MTTAGDHPRVTPFGSVIHQARFVFKGRKLTCAIGRTGLTDNKREGDGATPRGAWPLRRVFYRADRIASPETALQVTAIDPDMGWCDDPDDPAYNQLVRLPVAASAETLWRDDHIYDLIIVLGYNDAPVKAGKGSAIFLHIARDGYGPTEGCVALAEAELRDVLAQFSTNTQLEIG